VRDLCVLCVSSTFLTEEFFMDYRSRRDSLETIAGRGGLRALDNDGISLECLCA
jgi:hypothetical protein